MNQETHAASALVVNVKNEPQTPVSIEALEPLGEQVQNEIQVVETCTPLRTRPAGLLSGPSPKLTATIEVAPPAANPTTRFGRWRGARARAVALLSWGPKKLSAIIGAGLLAAKHTARLGRWLAAHTRIASLLSWRPRRLGAIIGLAPLAARPMTRLGRWLGTRIASLLSWPPRTLGAIIGLASLAVRPVTRLGRWLGMQQVGLAITIEGVGLSVARHWQLAWGGYAAACVAMFALGWHLGFGR